MIASADGCKGGWVVAVADGWPFKTPPRLMFSASFEAVVSDTRTCHAVAVDMPIGLPSGPPADDGHRECDRLARQHLGHLGRDRVFFAPPRPALMAKTPAEFQSIHKGLLKKGAGLPVWGIAEKLAEVDAVMSPAIQDRVFEFHPELAWARLAGRTLSSKHCAAGIIERLGILREQVPKLDQLNEWDDPNVSRRAEIDDILDALVGLAVAGGILESPRSASRLPVSEPPKDGRGLRMEIWY